MPVDLKLSRCPYCKAQINIIAMVEDEASKQVMAKLLKLDTLGGAALMGYLALFCPPKSQLSASRSLRLIGEVEALGNEDWGRLTLAMATTADTIRDKRLNGEDVKAFKNHNYLKKVFEQTPAQPRAVAPLAGQGAKSPALTRGLAQTAPLSATGNALAELEAMKHE